MFEIKGKKKSVAALIDLYKNAQQFVLIKRPDELFINYSTFRRTHTKLSGWMSISFFFLFAIAHLQLNKRELGLWANKWTQKAYLPRNIYGREINSSHIVQNVEHHQNIQIISSTHVKNAPQQSNQQKKQQKTERIEQKEQMCVCMQMRIYNIHIGA